MINLLQFIYFVSMRLRRDIIHNREQRKCVIAIPSRNQFIIAGPGSGKTTVLVLKILKFALVDDIPPESILITTFTKKAAKEIRSRILGWGDELKDEINNHPGISQKIKDQVSDTNLNDVITGTLDSIVNDILTTYRAPGTGTPSVIHEFMGNIIIKKVLRQINGLFDADFEDYIRYLKNIPAPTPPQQPQHITVREKCEIIRIFHDRKHHDRIDINNFRNHYAPAHLGVNVICDAIEGYEAFLADNELFDFPRLESEFLRVINNPSQNQKLLLFLNSLKIILVDEYQDTNHLQESIYQNLAEYAVNNNGSLTVVGDDDQSLYRFRGATVDLFVNYPNRFGTAFTIERRELSRNYRSTQNIVDHVNDYIDLDPVFTGARVAGKPPIEFNRKGNFENFEILGIFESSIPLLAQRLSNFINQLLTGGVAVAPNLRIELDPQHGTINDVVLLCDTPREVSSWDRERLPLFLDQELQNHDIKVFNPRGTEVQNLPDIQRLCGLILECIDPNNTIQNQNAPFLGPLVDTFNEWRDAAVQYYNNLPPPNAPLELFEFVENHWQSRTPFIRPYWPKNVAVNSLIYSLIYWIPFFYENVEGIVYLNAITVTISQFSIISTYNSSIVTDLNHVHEVGSITEFMFNILVPIAEGLLDLDEELYETLPPGSFKILSIHQAKGLEFPIVILDVGSDFNSDNFRQKFRRYPHLPANISEDLVLERLLRQISTIPVQRDDIDRAFDDLTRKFFVANSRAKDILILAGIEENLMGQKSTTSNWIGNVATGWRRCRQNAPTDTFWEWGRDFINLNNFRRLI